MKNEHLLLLLLTSATLVGCDTRAKTSKGYDYSGGYEFNRYTPPKYEPKFEFHEYKLPEYEPKLEFPAYKLPEPKCSEFVNHESEFDIPKHEPFTVPDLYESVVSFNGQSLRTIQTDVGAISVRIYSNKLEDIKHIARQIAELPTVSEQLGPLKENLIQAGEGIKSSAALGNTNLDFCIGKTLLTKDGRVVKLEKQTIDAIKKDLEQLVMTTIEEEYKKAEEEMVDVGSDTDSDFSTDSDSSTDSDRDSDLESTESDLYMRHANNGEVDIRLTDWYKSEIKMPFFAKVEKSTEHTLTNVEFVKFGNILFGAKQKFNTLKNTLESLGATSTIMFDNAFMELHLETNQANQSQKKVTLGYDFKEWGITPYLQAKSLKNSYAVCGITFDAYHKQSAFFKYSLSFNTQTIHNLTNGNTSYTLNTYGLASTTDGVKASCTMKLAPSYTEVKLSLGFEL